MQEDSLAKPQIQTLCLMVLAAAAVTLMIYWLRPVLVPLVVAVFVVNALGPILNALEQQLGVSRVVAAAIAFLVGLALLVLFGCAICVSVIDLSRNSENYLARIEELVLRAENAIPPRLFGPRNVDNEARPDGSRPRPGDAAEVPDDGQLPLLDATQGNVPAGAKLPAAKPAAASGGARGSQTGSRKVEGDDDVSDSTGDHQVVQKPALESAESPGAESPGAESPGAESPGAESPGAEDPVAGSPGAEAEVGEVVTTRSVSPRLTLASAENEDASAADLLIAPPRTTNEPKSDRVAKPPSTEAPSRFDQFVQAFLRDGISRLSQTMLQLASTSLVVLIYVFFLLIGTSEARISHPTWCEIEEQMRSYMALKAVISLFTGAAFGFTLYLFGVPMALTFGVLAFLLNFVPNIGPIVASLLPIPLIVLDPSGHVGWMAAVIFCTALIQFVSGNVVEPKLMGESSDLHPVTVLVALMFWGMMWGIVGMFLATPITAAMRIVFQRFDSTRMIAEIMSGRWPDPEETDGQSDNPLASAP